jgi:oligopeptide transport system substrate-binding protein
MKISSSWSVALISLVMVMFVAACGGDDDDATTPGETATTGNGEYSYILTDAPGDAAPPEDQKLTVNLTGEPDTIDPQQSNFADNITVERLLFAGLLTFDDDMNVVPLVAREVPTTENGGISADAMTYTFRLRDDVTWTDGQTVTAEHFEYAIKRLFDPTVGVYYASFFTDIVGSEDLYNLVDATPEQVTAMSEDIAVSAVDDTTLQITLTHPVATFVQRMTMHAVYPAREDVIAAHPDDWTEPANIVTNGPFTLKEWAHQDHITLEANPDFFLGEPVLQEITFIMQSDRNVSYAAYQGDDLDGTTVPPSARSEVRNSLPDELQEGATLTTFGVQFNNAEPPFDDPAVRKAFTAAFDRDAYVTGVLQGSGIPTITWLPPGIPGYDAEVGIPFDREAAKQYLAASTKYPNGQGLPDITYTTADDSTNQLIAEYVKAQIKDALDIDVEIEILESAAFESATNESDFQMIYSGWGADYPDPDNWFLGQFMTGASSNIYNYSNAEVDALLGEAAVELDNERRIDLYRQVQKIVLVDDAGIAPLDHSEVFYLIKPKVRGWRQHPMDSQIPGDFSYARVYIAN